MAYKNQLQTQKKTQIHGHNLKISRTTFRQNSRHISKACAGTHKQKTTHKKTTQNSAAHISESIGQLPAGARVLVQKYAENYHESGGRCAFHVVQYAGLAFQVLSATRLTGSGRLRAFVGFATLRYWPYPG